MALRRNANTDRDVEGRDTRALGQIMQPNGTAATKPGTMRVNPQTGQTEQYIEQDGGGYAWNRRNLNAANGETMANPGGGVLGQIMAPAVGSEPMVARDSPEFNQRVQRNRAFLQSPEIRAGMMQMGLNLMSGGDLGNAIGGGMEAIGQVATNRDAQALLDRKMNLEERGMNIQEDKQTLDEAEFRLKAKTLGGRTYSKLVDGESPIGMELGLAKGERARVKFVEDRNGNIISADMEANPLGADSEGGKGTKITQLLKEATAAELAGRPEEAQMLRDAAKREATGQSTALTLKPGQRIEKVDGVDTVVDMPGSEGFIKAQKEKETEGSKRIQEIQIGINVSKAVDKSLNMINNSRLPPDLALTGFGSYIQYIRGTKANDFAQTLDTIKSNLGFVKLQQIRNGNSTGGGLGPVSDFENKLLQATVANLDNSQSAELIKHNLLWVKAIFTDVKFNGKLTEIGNMLADGRIKTEAEAVNLAGEYLDEAVNKLESSQIGAQKDLTSNPPKLAAPKEAGEGYYHLPPNKQQRMRELLDKKNSGEK